MIVIITIITIIYLIFLYDFKIAYSNERHDWNIEYNGLLWVCLSHWSIWRGKNNDKPIRWFVSNNKPN